MHNSIWKLTCLVGISGLGFMVLLQVQKSLEDARTTAEATAEASADVDAADTPDAAAEPPGEAPADHFASIPPEATDPFFGAEPAGLDFRTEPSNATSGEPARLPEEAIRTAAVADFASASESAADPFGELRAEAEPMAVEATAAKPEPPAAAEAGESPEITLTAFEQAAPAADAGPPPGDFGPDPFAAELGPRPNPVAAGFDEPAPAAPASPASPASQLNEEDPFGEVGAAPAPANPANPAPESPTPPADPAPAADGWDWDFEEPAAAPAEPAPAAAPPAAPAGDPFADPPPAGTPPASPGLLPADDADLRGVGTVGPGDPRGPQQAQLTIEKKAPPSSSLGQSFVYEIVVKNVGKSPAHSVTVEDLVPKGTQLQGTVPQAELVKEKLVWNLGTLEPRQQSTIKIKIVPVEPGPIGSVATVNFVSEIAARTEIVAPQLTLKVAAPPQANLGEPVAFTFEIANRGTAPAQSVLLRDAVPEGFRHPDGTDLEYEVGTLAPGKSESVTLTLAAVRPGSFTNRAVLTAAGGLKTEAAAAVEVVAKRIHVVRQGPKKRLLNRPAVYSNVVKNSSAEPVAGVKVTEQVPPGMEFQQASHGGQFDADRRAVVWRLGPLAPGEAHTVQVMLTAAKEGVQDSVVQAVELQTGPAASGGSPAEVRSRTAVQGFPSLGSAIEGPDGPIAVGERAALRIRVKNRGNAAADGVAVAVSLPPELKFVEARGGKVQTDPSGGAAVQLAAPIAAGGEQAVDFVVEGVAAGAVRITAGVHAAHMTVPLTRDEELVIVAPGR